MINGQWFVWTFWIMMNKVFDIGAICWQHCKVHIQSILKSPDNGYKFCLFIKLQTMKTEKNYWFENSLFNSNWATIYCCDKLNFRPLFATKCCNFQLKSTVFNAFLSVLIKIWHSQERNILLPAQGNTMFPLRKYHG